MKIERITAGKDEIKLALSGAVEGGTVTVAAYVPLVHGSSTENKTPGRAVLTVEVACAPTLILPRYAEAYDLLICRFEVSWQGRVLGGVKYVTDFSEDFSEKNIPVPQVKRPVGTWVTSTEEDMDYLGFGCMMTEVNSTWIQSVSPAEEDIPHVWNGKTYYFAKEMMDVYDKLMVPCIKRGIPCLIRLINRFSYRLRGSDDALRRIIGHPDYEDTGFNEQMSAFNIRTEEGLDMYCACVDFLCARYADPASPLFCSWVVDVGNEINAQATWHNCGSMTCRDFMEEYTQQLRLAYLIGRKYNAYYRANVSFDHYFERPLHENDPLRYYGTKECLAYLAAFSQRDGDFPWGIAAHPYPEDLTHPDFYNDTTAEFSFDTPRVTMKNMEIWQALTELPELQYRGTPRRVVFDEQGFHTRADDPETENKGAAAFVLAYLKMRKAPSLDWFLINRYADMPLGDESGLCLGLRYEQGYADESHLFINPGPYKKICFAIRDMETDREADRVAEARAYIGEALFDGLLDPPAPAPTHYFEDMIRSVCEEQE